MSGAYLRQRVCGAIGALALMFGCENGAETERGERPKFVSGVVTGESGSPVRGARIAIVRIIPGVSELELERPSLSVESEATSDAAGRFSLRRPEGKGPFDVYLRGASGAVDTANVEIEEGSELHLVLHGEATLALRVRDPIGAQPLAATLHLECESGDEQLPVRNVRADRADEIFGPCGETSANGVKAIGTGEFQLHVRVASRWPHSATWRVAAPGHETARLHAILSTVLDGCNVPIELARCGASAVGRLVDADASDTRSLRVRRRPHDLLRDEEAMHEARRRGITVEPESHVGADEMPLGDAQGNEFRFSDLLAGANYELVLASPYRAGPLVLSRFSIGASGRIDLKDVRVPAPTSLRGVVRLAGIPSAASIEWRSNDRIRTIPQAFGSFRCDDLAPGRGTLYVRIPQWSIERAIPLELREGETVEKAIDVPFDPLAIAGEVVSQDGKPVPGAKFVLRQRDVVLASGVSDECGSFVAGCEGAPCEADDGWLTLEVESDGLVATRKVRGGSSVLCELRSR